MKEHQHVAIVPSKKVVSKAKKVSKPESSRKESLLSSWMKGSQTFDSVVSRNH